MQRWKPTARWGALVALLAPVAVTGFTTAPAAQASAPLDPYHVTALPNGTPAATSATGPMAVSADGALLAVAEAADVAIYRTVDDVRLGTIPLTSTGTVVSVSLTATSVTSSGATAGTVVDGVEFDPWTTLTSGFTPGTSKRVTAYADAAPIAAGDLVDLVPVSATRAYALLRGDRTTAINRSIALIDVAGTDPTTYVATPLTLPDVYSALAFSPRTPAALYALTQPAANSGASSIVAINTTTGTPSAPVPLNTSSTVNPALSLAISPDGTRLYIGEKNQLVVVPPATRTQATLTLPPASAGYPTGPRGRTNPLGLPQYLLPDRTVCDAVSVSSDGDTVYCTGVASANLSWFDATTLTYEGTLPLPGDDQMPPRTAANVRHGVAVTAARAYVALVDGSVTSIPVASVLEDNAVPYGSTPDAPRNVVVNAGNQQFTVSWAAPTSDGGLPIVGYEVDACNGTTSSASCDPAVAPSAICTAGGTGTSCTLTVDTAGAALVAGNTYRITVTALNALGAGTVSPILEAKLGVPTAPTGVTLGASTSTVLNKVTTLAQQVSWTAPSSSGSNAITSYQVCVDPVAAVGTDQKYCAAATTQTTVKAPATSATITGLTLAASYVLTVMAQTPKGYGVSSTPLTFIAGTPSAPTSLSAKGINQSISLTWSPPATTGGSAVTGYATTISPAGGTSCGTLTASANACTITGLKNGTTYTVTVAATNANGAGPRASVTATPASVPGRPTITTVTPVGNGADVTWSAPSDDGGSPITGYTVTARYGGEQHTCSASAGAGTCTLTGLSTATPYSITVLADNAVGHGLASTPSQLTLSGAPSPVTGVLMQVTGPNVLVQWNAPSSAGAASIASYRAVAYDSRTGEQRECVTTSVTACSIAGLRPGVRYVISVYATNSDGIESGASTPRSVTIIATPGRPTATTRQHGARTDVTLRWGAVAGASSYQVRRTGGPVLKVARLTSVTAPTTTFMGLRPGVYHFTVTARSGAVSSHASAELVVKVRAATKQAHTKAKAKAKKKHHRR